MHCHKKTFMGFGLGAIQSGLFLYEAQASGMFDRFVVAEVVTETVEKVRKNKGIININIAHEDRIEVVKVGPITVLNPQIAGDQLLLIDAISSASMITTALPGVKFYQNLKENKSVVELIADGLLIKIRNNGPHVAIYTAENNNLAAEILKSKVLEYIPNEERDEILRLACFLNTVIGKMSGIINDFQKINTLKLSLMTPDIRKSILVEAFNKILISRIQFSEKFFRCRIPSFIEKDNLFPFEEAKLYGHNAIHSLGAYLGDLIGLQYISEFKEIPGMMTFLRRAFIEESGASLIHKYNGIDPLFTQTGFEAYVDDLLERMINPFLTDQIYRVCRDADRKLGWSDRLIGTIRICLDEGIFPIRYSLGAAAALVYMEPSLIAGSNDIVGILMGIWNDHCSDSNFSQIIKLINSQIINIIQWKKVDTNKLNDLFELCENFYYNDNLI